MKNIMSRAMPNQKQIVRTYKLAGDLRGLFFDEKRCARPETSTGNFLIELEAGRVVRCRAYDSRRRAEKRLEKLRREFIERGLIIENHAGEFTIEFNELEKIYGNAEQTIFEKEKIK
jgi:hypothetical protein